MLRSIAKSSAGGVSLAGVSSGASALSALSSLATIVPAQTGHLGAFRVNYSYVSLKT